MRILLDTHIYLWWLQDSPKLSALAREKIVAASEVFVSSASIWEIAIKVGIGKLNADVDVLVAEIGKNGFKELPVTAKHGALLVKLADVHKDPFDRILVAQALYEPLRFITADSVLQGYAKLVDVV